MNGKKGLLLGLSLGLCLGTALPAFGQPVSEPIQAYLNHSYYFTFDGERTELPEDGHVLVYEGRSYVPARFVAEQLGATVTWHSDTKEIEIRREKQVDSNDTTGNLWQTRLRQYERDLQAPAAEDPHGELHCGSLPARERQ